MAGYCSIMHFLVTSRLSPVLLVLIANGELVSVIDDNG